MAAARVRRAARPRSSFRALFPITTALVIALFVDRASPQVRPAPATAVETALAAAPRPTRTAAWAAVLPAVAIANASSQTTADLRLYTSEGQVDPETCSRFEQIAAGDHDAHALAPRLEQLVFKAAYHFGGARVVIVSGWRDHASRHTAGEALDFKLGGIRAPRLAAWLRGLARVGVGIYTHPRTQYVHLDVRDSSYHWIDASPPGIHWREAQMRDPGQSKRDASWTPEADLPSLDNAK